VRNPWSTDAVTEPDRRQALLALAPRTEAGLYLVPIVIE
jgi:aspartyl-tRNA(Asn)/glutamyl-tRNA(Gln) amidotransferase subunit C